MMSKVVGAVLCAIFAVSRAETAAECVQKVTKEMADATAADAKKYYEEDFCKMYNKQLACHKDNCEQMKEGIQKGLDAAKTAGEATGATIKECTVTCSTDGSAVTAP